MNRDKQIEEMAKVIHKGELDRNKGVLDCTEFTTDLVIKVGLQRLAGAKALYNVDYRKASEVAREIFEEIESKLILNKAIHCGQKFYYTRLEDDIAELKKKYIGEDTNVLTEDTEVEG